MTSPSSTRPTDSLLRPRSILSVPLAWLFATSLACTGEIAMPEEVIGDPPPDPTSPDPTRPNPSDPNRPPAPPPPHAAPATAQRLTDRQYLNAVADVFGVDVSAEAATLPLDPKLEGFRNAASALLPSDLRIEGYATLATTVGGRVDWGKFVAGAGGCADFGAACERAFLGKVGRRLFRRPVTDLQNERFGKIFAVAKAEGETFAAAAGLVATALLQSPEFLYRIERPESGGAALDDFDVATRLAILIWNSLPDEALLDAAERGTLRGAGRTREVERMLADPRAKRALRDYVDDWLDAERLLRTSRDTEKFPLWTGPLAGEMREEIHRLFERVAWRDDGKLTGVLSADETEVTPALAALYGLPAGASGTQSLSALGNRQGLLTQPGILTLTSVGGEGASIVDRGVFVLRNFLCVEMPEPPNNVPELPAGEKGKSERDRLLQHRADPACGACHDLIDPLGLAFETYDAIGRFRSTDEQGNPLTGAGTLKVGNDRVDYRNVREFVAALVRTPALDECFARKLTQYTFARPLGHGDDRLVKELATGFAGRGHRWKALVQLLTESAWAETPGVVP